MLTRFNARLARSCAYLSVAGLVAIVAIVAWQVFGRYVLNASPTWTETLALVLVLYVTLIGAAVGVRDAGHLGMESLLALVPKRPRRYVEMAIHVLVGTFGAVARHQLELGFILLALGDVEHAILRVHQRRELRHDQVGDGREVAFAL